MPPRRDRDALRTRLVEAAGGRIARDGAAALTLRSVAEDVGTSTMAIYTLFGGMDELRRAVRWDAFGSLADRLAAVTRTDDPVADLDALCNAYYDHAIAHPDLYRVMFLEAPFDETDAEVCRGTFDTLVGAVARCIDEGRFGPADPAALATELWAAGHGIVTLQLAGALPAEQAQACVRSSLTHLLAAFAR